MNLLQEKSLQQQWKRKANKLMTVGVAFILLPYWARNSSLYVSFTKAKDKNIDCGQLSWNMQQHKHQIVSKQD